MSVYRGEESLAQSFWLWFVSPVVLIFGFIDYVMSNSIAIVEFDRSSYANLLYGLRIFLLASLFFFGIGVVRSARLGTSRLWGILATAAVVLLCGAVSARVLDVFAPAALSEDQITRLAKRMNAQLPRPLELKVEGIASWQGIEYKDRVLILRYQVDRKLAERVAWDRAREEFVEKTCTMWKANFRNTPTRRIDSRFFSGSTLFQSISISPSECQLVQPG